SRSSRACAFSSVMPLVGDSWPATAPRIVATPFLASVTAAANAGIALQSALLVSRNAIVVSNMEVTFSCSCVIWVIGWGSKRGQKREKNGRGVLLVTTLFLGRSSKQNAFCR